MQTDGSGTKYKLETGALKYKLGLGGKETQIPIEKNVETSIFTDYN